MSGQESITKGLWFTQRLLLEQGHKLVELPGSPSEPVSELPLPQANWNQVYSYESTQRPGAFVRSEKPGSV